MGKHIAISSSLILSSLVCLAPGVAIPMHTCCHDGMQPQLTLYWCKYQLGDADIGIANHLYGIIGTALG